MTTPPIETKDLARLASVLAMLGSPHSGERDAAALTADRLVRGRGLEWTDLLLALRKSAPDPSPPRSPPVTEAWRGDCARALRHIAHLNTWEQSFVASLPQCWSLSPKQADKLGQIVTSLHKRGLP